MILKLLKSQFVIYGIVGVGVTLLKLLSLYILRDVFDVVTYLNSKDSMNQYLVYTKNEKQSNGDIVIYISKTRCYKFA